MVVVVGISFNLIIIRVHEGVALQASSADSATSLSLKFVTQPTNATGGMEVAISREVHHEVSIYDGISQEKHPHSTNN
jgi:hypothetical protein